MELTNQVCSLEPSQRLKELGAKQECTAYDAYWVNPGGRGWRLFFLSDQEDGPESTPYEWCKAFTVAELGEMLGAASEAAIIAAYGHVFNVPDTRFITATGLQDCMSRPDIGAKMLVYLIENKLITV